MYSPGRETLVKVSGAQTGLITANGGRPESSNVEIDFTDANDWEFGGHRGGCGTCAGLRSGVEHHHVESVRRVRDSLQR